jgi:hypothetical protein
MGNETEKDFRNRQPNPTETVDQSRKNPSHQSGQTPNQQDPSKKNPSHGDSRERDGEEGSEQVEKRRAS